MAFHARDASAQAENRFALGLSFTDRTADDPRARGSERIGVNWRIGHTKPGWGWQYGFNWYALDLTGLNVGANALNGELRVKPVLAGYGRTWIVGPAAITADLIGGAAYTTFTSTGGGITVRPGVAPIVKPEVDLWYDLGRKFGLSVNAGYIVARPRLTVSGPNGSSASRLNANTFKLTMGFVYSIF